MKNLFAYFVITGMYTTSVFGNGRPIDGSAIYKTGDIILMHQPQIELLKEDLRIKVQGDYSIVKVVYQLPRTCFIKCYLSTCYRLSLLNQDPALL